MDASSSESFRPGRSHGDTRLTPARTKTASESRSSNPDLKRRAERHQRCAMQSGSTKPRSVESSRTLPRMYPQLGVHSRREKGRRLRGQAYGRGGIDGRDRASENGDRAADARREVGSKPD